MFCKRRRQKSRILGVARAAVESERVFDRALRFVNSPCPIVTLSIEVAVSNLIWRAEEMDFSRLTAYSH